MKFRVEEEEGGGERLAERGRRKKKKEGEERRISIQHMEAGEGRSKGEGRGLRKRKKMQKRRSQKFAGSPSIGWNVVFFFTSSCGVFFSLSKAASCVKHLSISHLFLHLLNLTGKRSEARLTLIATRGC